MMLRFLVAAGVACSVAIAGCDEDPSHDEFDFFMLALQYPPAFHVAKGFWTIHGLWPSRFGEDSASTYPCSCSRERFDPGELSSIQDELHHFWPTLFRSKSSDESFWNHEWSKHGTCSEFKSQLEYFRKTLETRSIYNPGNVWEASEREFSVHELVGEFKKKFGAEPLLGCDFHHDKRWQILSEIGICLDKRLSIMECHGSVERIHDEVNNCKEGLEIKILPLPTTSGGTIS